MRIYLLVLTAALLFGCGDVDRDRPACRAAWGSTDPAACFPCHELAGYRQPGGVTDARFDRPSCLGCHRTDGHEGEETVDCTGCHALAYRQSHDR